VLAEPVVQLIVETHRVSTMEIDFSVNSLYNLFKAEQKSGEISPLPKDFYLAANEKLKLLGKPESDEYKNATKIINAIKERRTQKILMYLAYNKEVPRPMPIEEEDLYIQIKNILNKNSEPKPTKVKIAKAIPQIVSPTGNKLGPFEQNEIAYIYDPADIKFMVENKLGETTT
jgi:hypothetical protein